MKIIILPGWQQNKTHWSLIKYGLSDSGFETEVFDLPGFGEEPYKNEYTTLSSIADWTAQKIKSLYDEPVVIVGHSFGGRIAAEIAANDAKLVGGLILIGSPNVRQAAPFTNLLSTLSIIFQPIKFIIPEKIKQKVRSTDYKKVKGTELHNLFQNIINSDQTEILPKILCSVELLWGENDMQTPLSIAHQIDSLLPRSNLTVFKNTGHDVHLEKPQLLISKIIKYVKSL